MSETPRGPPLTGLSGEAARIRLEDATAEQPEASDFERIIGFAGPFAQAVKPGSQGASVGARGGQSAGASAAFGCGGKEDAVCPRDAAGGLLLRRMAAARRRFGALAI